MIPQDIFDKAVIGVIKQGGASISDHACAYRGPNGRKCAAGQLMENYEADEMEGTAIINVPPGLSPKLEALVDGHPALLLALQRAHDRSVFSRNRLLSDEEFMPRYVIASRAVAECFGLSFAAAQAAYDEASQPIEGETTND